MRPSPSVLAHLNPPSSAPSRRPRRLFATTISSVADGDGGHFLAEHADLLAIHPEDDAHRELQHRSHRQPNIVERVLPEHVQLERKRLDVAKATELQQLSEAVFRDDVK